MTRVLRLPTRSRRQARAIVRIQLDRLSPLPASETLFDLVPLRPDGTETVFALGIVRRHALSDSAFQNQRAVTVRRDVDDADVVFRFRNANAVNDWETRYLKDAPGIAIIVVAVTALALAANLRADRWREQRLPEIATAHELADQRAVAFTEQAAAQLEWSGLERTDAATRFLCVLDRISRSVPGGLAIMMATADADQVTLTLPQGGATGPLQSAGAVASEADPDSGKVIFPTEVCS